MLGPFYVCIILMGFFTFIFFRDRPLKELFEEKSLKRAVFQAVTIDIPDNLNLHVWKD